MSYNTINQKMDELRALIESRIESTTNRQSMLSWANHNQGKQLRSNNLPNDMFIRRQFGMTHVCRSIVGSPDITYLIHYQETGAVVPTPFRLKTRNPAYFKGIDERNCERNDILNDEDKLFRLSCAVDRMQTAIVDYERAVVNLKEVNIESDYLAVEKYAGKLKLAQ